MQAMGALWGSPLQDYAYRIDTEAAPHIAIRMGALRRSPLQDYAYRIDTVSADAVRAL
jgi:hypothetical protein